jgi:DHA1 family multidrug resistance protein-like MFS transporter
MFDGIGIEWGMTLLGCVAALFIPMPFVLYRFGKKIRAKSKFAPSPDIAQDKRRDEEARLGTIGEEDDDSGVNGNSSGVDEKKDLEKKE